jgi:structural maintenance of chromosome 3 (chondroitin sulfate proteoglycan 6)
MIQSLSSSAQFIVTTFRPELVSHAESHWGVIFDARKVSTIKSITEEDAHTFVESNERVGPGDDGARQEDQNGIFQEG